MNPIFFDTETCGLHGMVVLIQYAEGDGPINLYNVWKNPIHDTLELITKFAEHEAGVVGFNLAFDWFHLCKLYTTFHYYITEYGGDSSDYPEDIIDDLVICEKAARDGPCVKPVTACDLMLHARKGPYQSTMDRHDIRIRRVPTQLAYQLAEELNKRVKIPKIYFARKASGSGAWDILEIKDEPDFKDIKLTFAPSSALKALAQDALGEKDVLLFKDVEVDRKFWPEEYGWAPFALASNKKKSWQAVIWRHINHWQYNKSAREYAEKDVDITRRLYYFFGSPVLGDDDSVLACCVAAVRWRGFSVDVDRLIGLRDKAITKAGAAPKAPNYVKDYIWSHLTEDEKLLTDGSTKKVILEEIASWIKDDPESVAAIRAQEVLDARQAQKEVELYDKLITAGRFHASFKVIGTLSSRMAGADGLNPQGIKRDKFVRSCFPLAHGGLHLCGGDFVSFEVVLAAAIYNDPKLTKTLLTCEACSKEREPEQRSLLECPFCGKFKRKCLSCGNSWHCAGENCKCGSTGPFEDEYCRKKIHAMFGEELYNISYDEVLADKEKYSNSKGGVFSQIYGGDANTIHNRLGISIEVAENAADQWAKRFPGIKKSQKRIFDSFCSMRQPGGIGSKVIWNEPADYIESITGFRRYFTLENRICKALFDLGENPPKSWLKIEGKIVRRDREQKIGNAVRSALFAAAFGLQGCNMRAAANHEIQSPGSIITKRCQRNLWDLQPSGITVWLVQPMNMHDEIMCPTRKHLIDNGTIDNIVNGTVESFREDVPLIEIDWSNNINSWADK